MSTFELCGNLRLFYRPQPPTPILLALDDLKKDISAVTDNKITPGISEQPENNCHDCIIAEIDKEKFPHQAIENFCIQCSSENVLRITGSDMRGLIYGIYTFSRKFLNFDPLYYWTQQTPRIIKEKKWDNPLLYKGNPSMIYRGIFINDEDFLTGWEKGKDREVNYSCYNKIISLNVARKIAETILRLGYNMVIPGTFMNIQSEAEFELLNEFARRGLILTMHHIEPLGVSAFGFDHYWLQKGEQHLFSYFHDPKSMLKVWCDSIQRWNQFPEVIWQLGLRGRNDRPFWDEVEGIPPSDEARAGIISNVISEQVQLVRKITGKQNAIFSMTLWGEGAWFCQKGLLKIPKEVITVFADNCGGWKMQDDFYNSPIEPGKAYGIYCHHAVMIGQHLTQAIGVQDFYDLIKNLTAKRNIQYAIFNVANFREFIYGIQGTAEMTSDLSHFSPKQYLNEWIRQHFSSRYDEIAEFYRRYFNAFEKNHNGVALFTDALLLWITDGLYNYALEYGRVTPELEKLHNDPFGKAMSDMFPIIEDEEKRYRLLKHQTENMKKIYSEAIILQNNLSGEESRFFYAQIIYPSGVLAQLGNFSLYMQSAVQANAINNKKELKKSFTNALNALLELKKLIPEYTQGEFKYWYRCFMLVDFFAEIELLKKYLAKLAKNSL